MLLPRLDCTPAHSEQGSGHHTVSHIAIPQALVRQSRGEFCCRLAICYWFQSSFGRFRHCESLSHLPVRGINAPLSLHVGHRRLLINGTVPQPGLFHWRGSTSLQRGNYRAMLAALVMAQHRPTRAGACMAGQISICALFKECGPCLAARSGGAPLQAPARRAALAQPLMHARTGLPRRQCLVAADIHGRRDRRSVRCAEQDTASVLNR